MRMRSGDRGSLPMALLLILVGVALSALLAPVVLNHVTATRSSSERTRALHAAQAGIDVMLGRIRASTDSAGNGMVTLLPGPELTGSAAPGGTERYWVTVTYYAADGAQVAVVGVANPPQPAKAVLVARGVESASVDPRVPGAPGTRTLRATYRFRDSNENIPGGRIAVNGDPALGTTRCVAAGAPSQGSPVIVRPCASADPNQRFAYTRNLTLQLVGSEQTTPQGLCLRGTGGQAITLAPCAAGSTSSSADLLPQLWSLRSYGQFYGTDDGKKVNQFCLNVRPKKPNGTSDLGADACLTSPQYTDEQTLLPEPTVGAGWAGAAENWFGNGNAATPRQLVSVGPAQFGRCLDIAGGYPDPTRFDYMIAWPCKQSPDPAQTPWTQMWTLPDIDPKTASATGLIRAYAVDPGRPAYDKKYYCLRSSGSTTVAPFVVECPTGAPPQNLLWTITADTSTYATSYQIKENTATGGSGLCLTPTGPNPSPAELYQTPNYIGPPVSKVLLRPCDGSQWQKWNAPPYLGAPPLLSDFAE